MPMTLQGLAKRLMVGAELISPAVSIAVKKGALKVRDDAVKKFGTLQPAVGPFPAWEPLKPETIAQKGASGDGNPLIGSYGEYIKGKRQKVARKSSSSAYPAPLRNTIEIDCDNLNAVIGSKDPLGPIHEYGAAGTGKGHNGIIPPRPFLRPALYENLENIQKAILLSIGVTFKKL